MPQNGFRTAKTDILLVHLARINLDYMQLDIAILYNLISKAIVFF
jgi:hypothetical protein